MATCGRPACRHCEPSENERLQAAARQELAPLRAEIERLQKDAERFRSALDHIKIITAPEMAPLYSVRPHECAGVSAHKIAKCALEAARETDADQESD